MTKAIQISQARMYEVIVAPVITEKSTRLGELSQVVFKVRPEATKLEIAAAVRGLFGVEVRSVNTMVTKGKVKRFRGSTGKRSDVKKAIVTLAEGQTIDVTTGI